MCDHWMPALKLPLTWEQFVQLPRHPAYKYEYLDGLAYLTPRPKHYHALLELTPREISLEDTGDEVRLRRMRETDFGRLVGIFEAAFDRTQPFGGLSEAKRRQAARECLEKTRTGGDGPWIERASFVALDGRRPVGAILITLLPEGDPCEWDSFAWREPPPADCVERRLGRPHLTWIFVGPIHAGHGVGSALLAAAGNELLAVGYKQLLSTFLKGNESSTHWHWRNGFQLLAYPGSFRLMRRRMRERTEARENRASPQGLPGVEGSPEGPLDPSSEKTVP